jgi:uncharacterized protein YndB with AHSA1/START domain
MTVPASDAEDQHMLLTQFRGRVDASIDADPDRVFAALTDIEHLPQWNRRIAKVLRMPPEGLVPGAQWCVKMAVPPATWPSKAQVVSYDPARRVFAHVSQSDDGNPSFIEWTWTVTPTAGGSTVRVEWVASPKTFWRRLLLARIRERQLPREVEASMAALAYHLAPRDATV